MPLTRISTADLFDRFTHAFETHLLREMQSNGLSATTSIDENISLMGQKSGNSLKSSLLAALSDTVGQQVPTGRLGDRIQAFAGFVTNHHRTPRDQWLFNDVLYKIKTTDEILDPLRVFVTDKEFVKVYVKAIVGDQYNVRTLDILRNVGAIETYRFPSDCAIKATHGNAQNIIRQNDTAIDRELIKKWFRMNYYLTTREANYRRLKPKVIVEELAFGNASIEDYKIFCFNGVPKLIWVDVDRHANHQRAFFDVQWQALDFSLAYPKAQRPIRKPGNLAEMLDVASRLSKGFGLVRIDLYSNGSTCLVGEITNCSGSANKQFIPVEAEKTASSILFS